MKYSKPEFQVLASRLDKLEAQNRSWKVAGILLGLFIVSLVFIAAKPADRSDASVVRARSVEAQDFILKDADDQVRARLSLNSTNKVEINGRIFLLRAVRPGSAVLR